MAELWSERKSGGMERSLEGGEHPCFIMKACFNMYPYSCLNGSLWIFYLRHVTSIQHVQRSNIYNFLCIYLCSHKISQFLN